MFIYRFFDWYFKAYAPKGFVLQQKARILFYILLLMLGLDVGFFLKVLLFTDKLAVSVLVVTVINFFSLCGVGWVLKSGHFSVAGHALIGLTQGILWIALFTLDIPLVSRLDGIFMVFTVFTLCALIVNRYRGIIALYFLLNSALLILLAFDLQSLYAWSTAATWGMIGDNIISLACIAFVAFSVVSINNAALQRAQKSIAEAELEAARNSHLSQTLERKVEQRTQELKAKNEELLQEMEVRRITDRNLKELQKELIDNAHKTGMAEIAANTLHNVGNVLTSLNTSASLIREAALQSPLESYAKANQMLRENWEQYCALLVSLPKGKALLEYYLMLETVFSDSYAVILENAERMLKKADTIAHIINSQRGYTQVSGNFEAVNAKEIIEEALQILPDSFFQQEIKLVKTFHKNPQLQVQKSKFIHILINLIANAEYALQQSPSVAKNLWIEVDTEANTALIKIRDSGCGIPQAVMGKLFKHGFTTKTGGNGFGLHSCAIYMEDMKGSIQAYSDGEGFGAEFRLRFPLSDQTPNR